MSSKNSESSENEVLFETKGTSVIVTLNRPKALNALNISMIRAMTPRYKVLMWSFLFDSYQLFFIFWMESPCRNMKEIPMWKVSFWREPETKHFVQVETFEVYAVASVTVRSDSFILKWINIFFDAAIYDSKKKTPSTLYKDFFREEYILNYLIGTLQTPHIALLNGITSTFHHTHKIKQKWRNE